MNQARLVDSGGYGRGATMLQPWTIYSGSVTVYVFDRAPNCTSNTVQYLAHSHLHTCVNLVGEIVVGSPQTEMLAGFNMKYRTFALW